MIKNYLKFCRNCALRNIQTKICSLSNLMYDDDNPSCKYYCEELIKCGYCGRSFPKLNTIIEDNFICPNCENLLGTCAMCENNYTCDFMTNPSPLPKNIIKLDQVGNTQVRVNIKNPERVKITCENGCGCYNGNGCSKETDNICKNYCLRKKSY